MVNPRLGVDRVGRNRSPGTPGAWARLPGARARSPWARARLPGLHGCCRPQL